MLKKILYIFLPVSLLTIGFAGCNDDDVVDPLPETVPLIVEASAESFVQGETLTLTFRVKDDNKEGLSSNEDFDIYLSAKDGAIDVSKELFISFPSMVTFKKGEESLKVDLPIIKEGMKEREKRYVNIVAFVRGYNVTNSSQEIVISDLHYITMSIKSNSDRVIEEGASFTIQATLPVPVEDDTDINITVPEDQKSFYETLPTKLTIKAGEKSGEVIAATKHNLSPTKDEILVLEFSTLSVVHPLDNEKIEITMKDLEAEKGSKLLDERWVYDRPGLPFTSGTRKEGGEDAVIKKYGEAQSMSALTPHPNAELAAAGWKFYNAWEFHRVGNTNDMWQYKDAYDTYVPMCLTAQNTTTAQTSAAVINDQFSNIIEDGYLRMIEMKIKSNATAPAKGERDYGTAAFYSGSFANAYKANSTLILEGSRMEIRARVRGRKQGFNMAIWLWGNADSPYGEIDILENPATTDGNNRAFQTFHVGEDGNTAKSVNSLQTLSNMSEWNIYWMEWRDANTVVVGINGETTYTLTSANSIVNGNWPFTNERNPKGLKFILTMGAPNKWALNGQGDDWKPDANWDIGFRDYDNYKRDRDNENIPRLEIDWVRTYINKASITEYESTGVSKNGTKFY